MPDRFTGTMLTKINTQGGLPEDPAKAFGKMSEETDKALLDILKKVNELAGTSADASATGSTLSGLGGALSSAIKGMKYGLNITYLSSDALSISPGAVEINGELVVCSSPLAISSGMANFPSAGAWAYVTMEKGGTHRLFPATGTANQRPIDSCFQLTGGGVGYFDLNKQGFYYDSSRKIIGAIFKESATSWFKINMGPCLAESGQNFQGHWRRFNEGRKMQQYGTRSQTTNASSGAIFYNFTSQVFPVTYAEIYTCVASDNYAGVGRHAGAYNFTVSGFEGKVEGQTNGNVIPYSWYSEGVF